MNDVRFLSDVSANPLVWDALERRGYGPHGQPHDFRSRCPGHHGDGSNALHVTVASDGTVLLHCFSHGCSIEDIVEPLGLRLRDLFPADQRYSARLYTARRQDFTGNAQTVADVLLAYQRLGLDCRVSIAPDECPDCESPHPLLVIDLAGEPFVHCQRGCSPEAFTGGLADRVRRTR
jgi:hypothetical protein